ncbi:hypothetical protein ACVIGA_002604 [Bradyrhizobium sp. USDA 3240]
MACMSGDLNPPASPRSDTTVCDITADAPRTPFRIGCIFIEFAHG